MSKERITHIKARHEGNARWVAPTHLSDHPLDEGGEEEEVEIGQRSVRPVVGTGLPLRFEKHFPAEGAPSLGSTVHLPPDIKHALPMKDHQVKRMLHDNRQLGG